MFIPYIFRDLFGDKALGYELQKVCLVSDLFFIFPTSRHNYFPSLGTTTIGVWNLCVWDKVQEGVIVHCWIDCPLITLCVWSMEVKAIDYFNPPYLWVCDPHGSPFDRGIANGPQRSLCQTSPRPINFQLESARNESRGLGPGTAPLHPTFSAQEQQIYQIL